APPTERLARWTRCQSSAYPSRLEYWHMGDTAMRFGSVTPRIAKGSSRWAMICPQWVTRDSKVSRRRTIRGPAIQETWGQVPGPRISRFLGAPPDGDGPLQDQSSEVRVRGLLRRTGS